MLTFAARRAQYDIDVDVERSGERQQSACGESGRPILHQARDIGLRNPEPGRSSGLGQAERLDALGNLKGQLRLDEFGGGIGHTEIGEHVA
jgi:hypothetical protein